MVYRVSDLVPLTLVLMFAYRWVVKSWPTARAALLALVLCLTVGNLGAELFPRSFASNNPHLARMAFVKQNTLEGDWVAGDQAIDDIYLPYFAERRPLVLGRYAPDLSALRKIIQSISERGDKLYVTSRALQQPVWKAFFEGYELILKAQRADGFTLFEVRRYHGAHDP